MNRNQAREWSLRQCLARLWKESDRLYRVKIRLRLEELRVELCAREMREVKTVKELRAPFAAFFRNSPRPPEIGDILELQMFLARGGDETRLDQLFARGGIRRPPRAGAHSARQKAL